MSKSHRYRHFSYQKFLAVFVPTLLLIIISLFSIYPILLLFFTSGKPQSELVRNPFGLPRTFFTQNYTEVWNSEGLPHFLMNSIIVSGCVVLGTVILSALAGFGLARLKFRGKNAILIALVMGLVVPAETLVIPLFYMMRFLHLLSTYAAMILPQIALGLPFSILLVHSFMVGLPQELFEAAEIDGCSTMDRFLKIAVPLIRPALIGVAIFQFIWSWNQYLLPLVLVQKPEMRTVPVMLGYYIGKHGANFGDLTAASVILFLPILVFYLVFHRSILGVRLTGALK
jgi:raffinose/stachyose/melibiose transport system permease protein